VSFEVYDFIDALKTPGVYNANRCKYNLTEAAPEKAQGRQEEMEAEAGVILYQEDGG
jgi:hypothetical protein